MIKNAIVLSFTLLALSYSTILAQEANLSPTPTATPRNVRDTLRERVEGKLTQLANKPRAYIGKITDIQDGSLLVETKNGVKQLKLVENIVIINTREKKRKTIESKNLVIGDLIVAMGFTNTKDVLDARRILVIGEFPTTTRRAVYGVVLEINTKGRSLKIKQPNKDETWTIKTDSKTRVTAKVDGKVERASLTDIESGDRITTVGTPTKEGNTLLARLIHVIPANASRLLKTTSPSPTPKPSATP